jgi:putative heme-binding domain-containing protein
MLTVDACISPKGELVVAVHSGPPDWGTGPNGKGKLYKITYSNPLQPQPVLAWAAGPNETRIAFDRPLDPQHLQDLTKQIAIEHGRYVYPGDRFESLRPGYEVVRQQLLTPRYDLPVLAAQVTGDRRTLVLTTGPQAEAGHYAVTLPGLGRANAPGTLPQHTAIDLGYDLCGIAASWKADDGKTSWSGWLPHLDVRVAKELTTGSAEHDTLWQLLRQPGRLTLRTKLNLWNLLRPAVQPGSSLDWTPPPEQVTLRCASSKPLEIKMPSNPVRLWDVRTGKPMPLFSAIRVTPRENEPLEMELVLTTGGELPAVDWSFSTDEDRRPRALPLHRFLLPWASVKPQPAEVAGRRDIPELKGGDWARGRSVFFSDQAMCARCHQLHGQGGRIGPDLSNLVHRDYESVLRDIREPSAALNPDYIPYVVERKDGRVLTGVVRSDGPERLLVGNREGEEIPVSRRDVEAMTPSPVSVMPDGLDKMLGPDKLRDLMTFLLTDPLQPAPLERDGAPPPRRRAEVAAVLKSSRPVEGPRKKLHIVLAAGPKDHGPGEHDYPLWQRRWVNLLSLAEGVTVSTADGWPTPRQWQTADVIVFYSANPAWSAERAGEMDAYLNRGGGLVYLHYAVDGRGAVEALSERIGLAWRGGFSRFRHGPLELTFADPAHPISRGFDKARFVDESYWLLAGDVKRVNVLASGVEDGQPRPLLWTHERGKGRVFVSILGHYTWTFDDPLFRILVLRGLAWTAGEPAERMTDLATVGARVTD